MRYLLNFKLFEDRQQLEIPFAGKDPLHDKPVHIHVLDALKRMSEEMKKDGLTANNFKTDENWQDYWDQNVNLAFLVWCEENINNEEIKAIEGDMFQEKLPLHYPEYYNDEFWQCFPETSGFTEENDYIERFIADNFFGSLNYDIDDLSDYLTDKGQEKLDSYFKRQYEANLETHDPYYNIEDEAGLIKIWRVVNYEKGNSNDQFEEMIKYQGVGVYWSWDEGAAYPHGGSNIGKDTFTLHGLVRPQDVFWENTIWKNASNLRDEQEIEVNEKAPILIYGLSAYTSGKKEKLLEIKPPLIVPA